MNEILLKLKGKRAELDAKIQEHLRAIRTLKMQRNQLASISRLSPDVLVDIFQLVQESHHSLWTVFDEPRSLRSSQNHSQLLRTRGITHVCSAWRNLALNSPSLWTGLEFDCPPLTLAMCARSKLAPLTIYYREIDDAPNTSATLLGVLRDYLHRVKFLSVSASSGIWQAHLTRLLRLSASNILEGLWCENISGIGFVLRNRGEVNLPIELLVNSASTLRSLGLLACHLSNASLIGLGTITLPRLQRIYLVDPVQLCADFLDHVVIPPSCAIILENYERDNDSSCLKPLIHRLTEARSAAGFPFDSLKIRSHQQDWTGFYFGLRSTALPEDTGLELIYHHAALSWVQATRVLLTILPSVQLEQITHLELSCRAAIPVWDYLATSCVGMTDLVVISMDAVAGSLSSYFQALAGATTDPPSFTPLTFPSMNTLTLRHWNFDSGSRPSFLQFLRHRSIAGKPIHNLALVSESESVRSEFATYATGLRPYIPGEITHRAP